MSNIILYFVATATKIWPNFAFSEEWGLVFLY